MSVVKRGSTEQVTCGCGTVFTARVADRKRGWAKSCSKSCAATKSNRETGKYQKFLTVKSQPKPQQAGPVDLLVNIERILHRRDIVIEDGEDDDYFDPSWDAHKEQF